MINAGQPDLGEFGEGFNFATTPNAVRQCYKYYTTYVLLSCSRRDRWRKRTTQSWVAGTMWWESGQRLHTFSIFGLFFLLQLCGDSLHGVPTETCERGVRESWLKPTGSGGEEGERKGGGASVSSNGLRPGFYLLAQGYLERIACLALWVADFAAVHTDLSSGSPGAEGCSGNSQRSFSSETQSGGSGSGSETHRVTCEWLSAFSVLGVNRHLIGACIAAAAAAAAPAAAVCRVVPRVQRRRRCTPGWPSSASSSLVFYSEFLPSGKHTKFSLASTTPSPPIGKRYPAIHANAHLPSVRV